MNTLSLPLLDTDQLKHFNSLLSGQNPQWLDGRLTAGEHAASVKNNKQLNPGCGVAVEIEKFISTQLCAHPLIKSFSLMRKVHSCLISRCAEGDGYGWHVDNPFSKHGRRDLSFTVFLSEPMSYEGGQLEIQSSQESSTYRLPAGHVLVYPSSSLHRVLPVTSGCRFAFVGWIESYVQAEEDRLLLFNLDAGARGLLSRHGRSEELDLVFQAYANAVRRLSR